MGKMYGMKWSFTRSEILLDCDRKFFYQYGYGDEPFGPEAKRLRSLNTCPMLSGKIADEVIGRVIIRHIQGKMSTELSAAGLKLLEKIWSESKKNAATFAAGELHDHKYPILTHHYFGNRPEDGFEECKEKVSKCLHAFEHSEVWRTIQTGDTAKYGKPRLMADNAVAPCFSLTNELEVYASFDFYFELDGHLHILDWKTGKQSSYSRNKALKQLGIYALYGIQVLGYPLKRVSVQPVWLDYEIEWQPQKVTLNDVENSKHSMLCESALVKDRVADTGKMFAGMRIYSLDIRDFPAKPSQMSCKNCNFSSICPDKFNGIKDPG
jgi:hypothetical protein